MKHSRAVICTQFKSVKLLTLPFANARVSSNELCKFYHMKRTYSHESDLFILVWMMCVDTSTRIGIFWMDFGKICAKSWLVSPLSSKYLQKWSFYLHSRFNTSTYWIEIRIFYLLFLFYSRYIVHCFVSFSCWNESERGKKRGREYMHNGWNWKTMPLGWFDFLANYVGCKHRERKQFMWTACETNKQLDYTVLICALHVYTCTPTPNMR